MTDPFALIAGGVVAVLLFDLLASLASRRFGFDYVMASVGSFALYLAIGWLAAGGDDAPVQRAALAAAIAGLADATLGAAIAWRIGPGRPRDGSVPTAARWVRTVLIVVALAAATGALGGAIRRPPTLEARAAE